MAQSATFHVSPFGSNTPPYDTYAKAANKVADAVLAASGYGDTVLVHTGSYNFDTTIYIPAGVTWAGVGRDSVLLNWTFRDHPPPTILAWLLGANEVYGLEFGFPFGTTANPDVIGVYAYAFATLKVHDCRFRALTLEAGGSGSLEVFECEYLFGTSEGIQFGGAQAWIHGNIFRGNSSGRGVYCPYASAVVIEHNSFDADGSPHGGPTGVSVWNSTTVTVRHNLILNSDQPIEWLYASGVIENNTMIGSANWWTAMDVFLKPYQTLIIRNNVMQDFAHLPQFSNECLTCDTTGRIAYEYNAFWPPVDSFHLIWKYTSPSRVKLFDSANFNAYPMFTPDSLFQLQYGSLLIDAGDPAVKDADSSRSDIGWWGGPQGSTYPYQNLAPQAPESLRYDYVYPHVSLWWRPGHEADLHHYSLHRGVSPGFAPSPGNRLVTVPLIDTTYSDSLQDSLTGAYYKVVAVDSATNESEPSNEVAVIPTGVFDADDPGMALPRSPRLMGNYPNPFNSSTVFEVYIPAVGASPAPVEIIIYDVLGRQVTIAYSGSIGSGTQRIAWDGCDDTGHALATGVYFARLKFWSLTVQQSVKVVIMR